jgi:hypothetical protein
MTESEEERARKSERAEARLRAELPPGAARIGRD